MVFNTTFNNISELYMKNTKNNSSGNRIGGVMVRVLASSAVERRFKLLSGQTKD
jgi:hypothetical protein